MRKNGFTLIELLVVIMVLSFVGSLVVAILVTTLRGSNKTTTLTDVRQNADYALSTMAKMIRNSQTISACSDNNSITFINPDSGTTKFACQPATISSNSASLFPPSISVSSCIISCTPSPGSGSPISVVVSFTVSSLTDQNITIPFQTSIQTRNY